MEKGNILNNDIQMEKPDKHHVSQAMRISISSDRSYWLCTHWVQCDEKDTSPHWSSSQTHLADHEKSFREIPTEDHTTKHLASTPQNCQNHQEQEKFEELPVKRSLKRHNN